MLSANNVSCEKISITGNANPYDIRYFLTASENDEELSIERLDNIEIMELINLLVNKIEHFNAYRYYGISEDLRQNNR